jgi:hypothetical protein
MRVHPRINVALLTFYSYASHVNQWLTVKKNILLMLPSVLRSRFSRRDEKTKLQRPNALEYELMQRWANMTGRDVLFSNDGIEGKVSPT